MKAFDFVGANTSYGLRGDVLYVPMRKRSNGTLSSQWTPSFRERLVLLFGGRVGFVTHDIEKWDMIGHHAFVVTRKGYYVHDHQF